MDPNYNFVGGEKKNVKEKAELQNPVLENTNIVFQKDLKEQKRKSQLGLNGSYCTNSTSDGIKNMVANFQNLIRVPW